MELRSSPRKRVNLEVELTHNEGVQQRCRTRDFSMGGVFLEAPVQVFPEGVNVDLAFMIPSNGEHWHAIKARVVRTTDDGMGLAFITPDVMAFRTLQEVLRLTASAPV